MSIDEQRSTRLWTPRFQQLFWARFAGQLGIAVAPIAVVFAVLDIDHSASAVGIILVARTVPQVVLTLLGGSVADRFARRTVLVVATIVSSATQVIAAALLFAGTLHLWQLGCLEAINGIAAAFVYPAAAALTPTVVPLSILQQANGVLRIGLNVAMIGGSASAGVIIAWLGADVGLAFDAILFAVSALLFWTMRAGRTAAMQREESGTFLRELAVGWGEVTRRTWVLAVVAAAALVNMAYGGVFTVLGPVIADNTFGRRAWGFIVAVQAIGMLAGGFVGMRWKPTHLLMTGVLSLLMLAPLLGLLGVTQTVVVLLPAAFIAGLGLEVFGVFWDSSLQSAIPQDRLGRVYAYDALGSLAFLPIGQIVAGPLAVIFGNEAVSLAGGLLVVVVLLATLSFGSVRHLAYSTDHSDMPN